MTPRDGIAVTGTGSVVVVPDLMRLVIGVSVLRDSVAAARRDAGRLAAGVTASLQSVGIEARDIQTARFAIHPEYRHTERRRVLDGYRVTSTLHVTIRDLERAGEAIDAAVAAGGNDVVVEDVSFTVDDDHAAVAEARRRAWSDADSKATELADLAGVTRGTARRLEERTGRLGGPVPLARTAAEMAPSPIEPGTHTVTVTIEVEFSIDER